MNKRLAELEQQVKHLYEKLGVSEETEKPEFVVKDWAITRSETYPIIRITKIEDEIFSHRFDHHFENSSEDGLVKSSLERKATPTEIETALRKEWARRTKEKGWGNPDEAEIEGHVDDGRYILDVNSGAYTSLYNERDDRLYTKNGIVYHDGNWATPKEKKSDKFFEWDVEEVKQGGTEIPCHKIGCRTIQNAFLMDLVSILDYVSDKTVEEVLDELKKLDL